LTLREQLLRLNAEVTGHRLLRDAIVPGGASLLRLPTSQELAGIAEHFGELVDLADSNTVVMERFHGTAVLSGDDAIAMGTLGVVARASGVSMDARVAHPTAELGEQYHLECETAGDVHARFLVRVGEVRTSLAVIEGLSMRASALTVAAPRTARRGGSGIGIVEGWRGSIVHRVEVDRFGAITRCKIVDPSFLNWPALSVALADTIVPDFPLANKSFNLSYAGNDL
jgi:Ni,Fe-hydrogenase III large subunit